MAIYIIHYYTMAFLTMAFITMAFITMVFITMAFITMAFSETHRFLLANSEIIFCHRTKDVIQEQRTRKKR